jgi:hypothetical protein
MLLPEVHVVWKVIEFVLFLNMNTLYADKSTIMKPISSSQAFKQTFSKLPEKNILEIT